MSINRVTLLGNVCGHPQIKTFEDGGRVCNFTVATNERGYTTKEGKEIAPTVEYHHIVVNKPGLVTLVDRYVEKGDRIYVSGKIKSRLYGDSNIGHHRAYEIYVDTIELLSEPTNS